EGNHNYGRAPVLPGRYSAPTYPHTRMDAYRAGRTVAFRDTRTDPGLTPSEREALVAVEVIAAVGVPLLKEGHLEAILSVQTSEPRDWTPEELTIIEETAERTWPSVQRARAETA